MSLRALPYRMRLEAESAFRRAFHLASPAFLAYYLLPEDLGLGLPKPYLVVTIWSATLITETLRLAFGVDLIGLRDYEKGQISAYFWGGSALALGLLFFPPPFVIVAMFGMAWVDPLCAWTRRRRGYPPAPLLVYALIVAIGLWLVTDWDLEEIFILAALASPLAIGAEYPAIRYVDDDFTMLVVPMVGMTLLKALL